LRDSPLVHPADPWGNVHVNARGVSCLLPLLPPWESLGPGRFECKVQAYFLIAFCPNHITIPAGLADASFPPYTPLLLFLLRPWHWLKFFFRPLRPSSPARDPRHVEAFLFAPLRQISKETFIIYDPLHPRLSRMVMAPFVTGDANAYCSSST